MNVISAILVFFASFFLVVIFICCCIQQDSLRYFCIAQKEKGTLLEKKLKAPPPSPEYNNIYG